MKQTLKALGRRVTKFTSLETFPKSKGVVEVVCTSDEVTAVCPVTGQPDWYNVEITYRPDKLCVESKTVKLFLQSFRNEGHFCEDFSSIIADQFHRTLKPFATKVVVTQKPRGGVSIRSMSVIGGVV